MAKNLYGTIPAAAWIIGHYFYDHTHYMFLAGEFYPYRLQNPRSSNPYLIYQDLYEPWKDRDEFSKVINAYRLALWGGVEIRRKERVIDDLLADRLKHICDKLNVVFFYPVVCRVNCEGIEGDRLKVAGSGLRGSSEFLIEDLGELEIDEILFLDFDEDSDFDTVVMREYYEFRRTNRLQMNQEDALVILEGRCDSLGIQTPFSAS